MNRKFLVAMIIGIFLAFTGVLGSLFYKVLQEKQAQSDRITLLPQFSLTNLRGDLITDKNLTKGNWVVFIFFNSECSYCQEEAQQFTEAKEQIKGIDFLWISYEKMSIIKTFEKKYQLANYPNSTFLQDSNSSLATALSISSTPQFLVYNAENKLIKNHKGAWRIDKLFEYIANAY